MNEQEIFVRRLRELMFKSSYTQKQIAALCHTTEASLSRYMNGERMPKPQILANLATALHTTTDYLLGTSEVVQNSENKELLYLQRNLGKLDPERLKKAEALLKTVFDDIFEDDDEG